MIINHLESLRLFGALFYYNQPISTVQTQLSALSELQLVSDVTVKSAQQLTEEEYQAQFLALFEGCGAMPAPPWGSVYLDKEQVMFGESTLDYREFLKANQIEMTTDNREPEDQFGLMLLACAYLVESQRSEQALTLLSDHLLPWCRVYFDALRKATQSPMYASLAVDVETWLTQLAKECSLVMVEKKVYPRQITE